MLYLSFVVSLTLVVPLSPSFVRSLTPPSLAFYSFSFAHDHSDSLTLVLVPLSHSLLDGKQRAGIELQLPQSRLLNAMGRRAQSSTARPSYTLPGLCDRASSVALAFAAGRGAIVLVLDRVPLPCATRGGQHERQLLLCAWRWLEQSLLAYCTHGLSGLRLTHENTSYSLSFTRSLSLSLSHSLSLSLLVTRRLSLTLPYHFLTHSHSHSLVLASHSSSLSHTTSFPSQRVVISLLH